MAKGFELVVVGIFMVVGFNRLESLEVAENIVRKLDVEVFAGVDKENRFIGDFSCTCCPNKDVNDVDAETLLLW